MTTERLILEQVHTFKGKFPDIPLPSDIDLKELGEDAFFVTLPIGKIGAKSTNGNVYGESVVRQLVEQVNANRPEGMWGHLRDDERGTKYEAPAIRWIAAMIDEEDGVAWGKGIPVTTEAREHLRIAKITNSAVGTSIYGMGQVEKGQVKELKLETIDLAPAPRVGVAITAKVPIITKEIENKENKMAEITEQLVSELNGKVSELTNQIKEQADLISAIKAVTSDDPVKTVSEMRDELQDLRNQSMKAIYDSTVAEFVKVPVSTEGGKSLTEYVTSVLGEFSKYKSADEIKASLNKLSESATYKIVAKALVSEAQGGAVVTQDKSENKTDPNGTKEITSETARAIAAKYGVVVK